MNKRWVKILFACAASTMILTGAVWLSGCQKDISPPTEQQQPNFDNDEANDDSTEESLSSLDKYKQTLCDQIDGAVDNMTLGNAATHTVNAQKVNKIADDGKTTLNQAESLEAAKEIYDTILDDMASVASDEEIISLRSAAVSELASYGGGASAYTVNHAAYRKAYAVAEASINAATDAAEISKELQNGKAEIDKVPTDKRLATDDLNAFKETVYAQVDESALEGDRKSDLKSYIDEAVSSAAAKVASSVGKEEIDEIVSAAKEEIAYKVDYGTKPFAEFKEQTLALSDEYFDDYVAEYDEIKAELESAKLQWAERIASVEAGENALNEFIEILSLSRAAADGIAVGYLKETYSAQLAEYAEEAKQSILSEQFKAKIDQVVETYTEIINSEDNKKPAEVNYDFIGARSAVDNLLKSLHTHEFKVKFVNTELEDGAATYQGKAERPTDPVSEDKKFVGWYADEELSTEFDFGGFTVVDDVRIFAMWRDRDVTINYVSDGVIIRTVMAFYDDAPDIDLTFVAYKSAMKFDRWCANVVLTQDFVQPESYSQNQVIYLYARFDRYKVNEELALRECWFAEEDEAIQIDSKLFAFSAENYLLRCSQRGGYYNAETVIWNDGRSRLTDCAAIYDLSQGDGRIEFFAKEDVTLYVYVGLGDIYWLRGYSGSVTLGGTNYTFDGQRKMVKLSLEMTAGQRESLYGSGDGYLWLFAAEAVLDENFTNARIEYYKHDDAMLDFEKTPFFVDYLSTLKTYGVIDGPQVDGAVFKAWSTDDKQFVPFTVRNLKAGEVIRLYPFYAADKVLVKFYDMTEGQYSLIGTVEKRPSSETLALTDTPTPAHDGYIFTGWHTKCGGQYAEYEFGTPLTADGDLELYALYTLPITVPRSHEVEYNADCMTVHTLAPTTDNGVITVVGIHDAKTDQKWGEGDDYTGAIFPTGSSGRSISITLKAGETVTIRFAPRGANNHCFATLVNNADKSQILAQVSADTDEDFICVNGILQYTAISGGVYSLEYSNQLFYVFAISVSWVTDDEVPVSGVGGALTQEGDGWDLSELWFTVEGGDERVYIKDTQAFADAQVIVCDEGSEIVIYILIGDALVRFSGTVE